LAIFENLATFVKYGNFLKFWQFLENLAILENVWKLKCSENHATLKYSPKTIKISPYFLPVVHSK